MKKEFEPNDYMEGLLKLQIEKPRVYQSLSLALRISVGRYAQLKSEHEARSRKENKAA